MRRQDRFILRSLPNKNNKGIIMLNFYYSVFKKPTFLLKKKWLYFKISIQNPPLNWMTMCTVSPAANYASDTFYSSFKFLPLNISYLIHMILNTLNWSALIPSFSYNYIFNCYIVFSGSMLYATFFPDNVFIKIYIFYLFNYY